MFGHRYECPLCRQVTVLQHTTDTIQQQQLPTVYALITEADTQPISANNNNKQVGGGGVLSYAIFD